MGSASPRPQLQASGTWLSPLSAAKRPPPPLARWSAIQPNVPSNRNRPWNPCLPKCSSRGDVDGCRPRRAGRAAQRQVCVSQRNHCRDGWAAVAAFFFRGTEGTWLPPTDPLQFLPVEPGHPGPSGVDRGHGPTPPVPVLGVPPPALSSHLRRPSPMHAPIVICRLCRRLVIGKSDDDSEFPRSTNSVHPQHNYIPPISIPIISHQFPRDCTRCFYLFLCQIIFISHHL